MNETVRSDGRVWRRRFLEAAGFGAGVSAVVVAAVVVMVWVTTRPRPWNRNAVTAEFTGLDLLLQQPLVLTFHYSVENHTGHDYDLPPDGPYRVLADGKGLQRDTRIRWEGERSVPSGHKVNLGIRVELDYPEGNPQLGKTLDAFTRRRLAEIDGFTALDQASRYEISFPKPAVPKIE